MNRKRVRYNDCKHYTDTIVPFQRIPAIIKSLSIDTIVPFQQTPAIIKSLSEFFFVFNDCSIIHIFGTVFIVLRLFSHVEAHECHCS